MVSDEDIGREILKIAEQMYADITDQDQLDDNTIHKLRQQGLEMEKLADQLE